MKTSFSLMFIWLIIPLSLFSSTILWEKTYDSPELYGSIFHHLIIPNNESSYIYAIGIRFKTDSSSIVFAKIDSDGNLIFSRKYHKIINGVIKPIFSSGFSPKLETIGNKEYITAVYFIPIYGTSWFYTGYWLYLTKFDTENGNLVYEGLDTLSQHTITYNSGSVFEKNNFFYNLIFFKDTLLLKVFDLDGNFFSEKRIAKLNLPVDDYVIGDILIRGIDSTLILVLSNAYNWSSNKQTSYLISISKNFTLNWIKTITLNDDILSIFSIVENKENRVVAFCRHIDSSYYFVEIDDTGSVASIIPFPCDHRINFTFMNRVSDGGYILLGKLRLTKMNQQDSSLSIFIKITPNYKPEQVFYHKSDTTPIAPNFLKFYELPDNSFIINGTNNNYPYILKIKDIKLTADQNSNNDKVNYNGLLLVDDYIDLSELPPQKISIYTLEGVKVYNGDVPSIVNTKSFSPGVYFMIIGNSIYKFIKI